MLEVPLDMSQFPQVVSLRYQDFRVSIQDWKRISELMRNGNFFKLFFIFAPA